MFGATVLRGREEAKGSTPPARIVALSPATSSRVALRAKAPAAPATPAAAAPGEGGVEAIVEAALRRLQTRFDETLASLQVPLEQAAFRALERQVEDLRARVERVERPRPGASSPGAAGAAASPTSSEGRLELQLRGLVGELQKLQQGQQSQRLRDDGPSLGARALAEAEDAETLRALGEERGRVGELLEGVRQQKLEVIKLMHGFAMGKEEALQELEASRRIMREESLFIEERSRSLASACFPQDVPHALPAAVLTVHEADRHAALVGGSELLEAYPRRQCSQAAVRTAPHAVLAGSAAPLRGAVGAAGTAGIASASLYALPCLGLNTGGASLAAAFLAASAGAGASSGLSPSPRSVSRMISVVGVSPVAQTRPIVESAQRMPQPGAANIRSQPLVRRFVSAGLPLAATAAGAQLALPYAGAGAGQAAHSPPRGGPGLGPGLGVLSARERGPAPPGAGGASGLSSLMLPSHW